MVTKCELLFVNVKNVFISTLHKTLRILEEIPTLLQKNLDLQNTFLSEHFFEIDILLEELKKFKFVTEFIINSEKGQLVLPKLLGNTDILIQTCEETLRLRQAQ